MLRRIYNKKQIKFHHYISPLQLNLVVKLMQGGNIGDKFKITYLKDQDLCNKNHQLRTRVFKPEMLMEHGLFKKHQPILFGGAALTFHFYDKVYQAANRLIDDLDFYVTDFKAYEDFRDRRKIQFQNKADYRLHFFQKMAEDYHIQVTICYLQQWKNKRYQRIKGIRVLSLKELKILKIKDQNFSPQICKEYRRDQSPTNYFVRIAKEGKDISDIFCIYTLQILQKAQQEEKIKNKFKKTK